MTTLNIRQSTLLPPKLLTQFNELRPLFQFNELRPLFTPPFALNPTLSSDYDFRIVLRPISTPNANAHKTDVILNQALPEG